MGEAWDWGWRGGAGGGGRGRRARVEAGCKGSMGEKGDMCHTFNSKDFKKIKESSNNVSVKLLNLKRGKK